MRILIYLLFIFSSLSVWAQECISTDSIFTTTIKNYGMRFYAPMQCKINDSLIIMQSRFSKERDSASYRIKNIISCKWQDMYNGTSYYIVDVLDEYGGIKREGSRIKLELVEAKGNIYIEHIGNQKITMEAFIYRKEEETLENNN